MEVVAEAKDVDTVMVVIQKEDVDVKTRVHVITFIMVGTIMHQINAKTSSVNPNGHNLLILHLH